MDNKEEIESEVDLILKNVDKNENGLVDYSEFVAATIE
jgi:Ca2+-binding EF-hand superfamily protein